MLAVQVEVDDALEPLLDEWETLFSSDPCATPYLSPGWACAWWRHLSTEGERPWIVTVRDAGELVGLAPLVLRRQRGARLLRTVSGTVWHYWDIVAEPTRRAEVTEAVAGTIAARRGEWDAFVANGLAADSPTVAALARVGFREHRRTPIPCPLVPLPATFDDYLGSLSAKNRKNLRRRMRSLEEGELELNYVRDPAQLSVAVDRWHEIRVRWRDKRAKDTTPLQRTQRFRDFMRAVVLDLVPNGLATVWELRRSGEVEGVVIGLQNERLFYLWTSGFEPALASADPGHVAIGNAIRESIVAGRSAFDFMVGDEPYKYRYGASDRYRLRLVYGSWGPRSLAVHSGLVLADRRRGWAD